MNNPLIVGLVLAALSGAALMAYQHPKIYSAYWFRIWGLCMGSAIAVGIWNFIHQLTWYAVRPLIIPDKVARAEEIFANLTFADEVYWILGGGATALWVLQFLADVMAKAHEHAAKSP